MAGDYIIFGSCGLTFSAAFRDKIGAYINGKVGGVPLQIPGREPFLDGIRHIIEIMVEEDAAVGIIPGKCVDHAV